MMIGWAPNGGVVIQLRPRCSAGNHDAHNININSRSDYDHEMDDKGRCSARLCTEPVKQTT